jgi:hypothetical protein
MTSMYASTQISIKTRACLLLVTAQHILCFWFDQMVAGMLLG